MPDKPTTPKSPAQDADESSSTKDLPSRGIGEDKSSKVRGGARGPIADDVP